MPRKYKCPEEGCDRSFTKPQGLGAHRARVHGYRANGETVPTGPVEPDMQSELQDVVVAKVRPLDSDVVLQEVFPNGVPAESSVLHRTTELLREANELHEIAAGDTALA